MSNFRNLPIGRKLTLITMVISGVALVLACAAFAIYEQAAFRRTMARDFAILADMFDENVASGLAFNDPAAIEKTLATLRANPRIVAACVYDPSGAVIGAYRRPGTAVGDKFKFPAAQATGQRWGAERLDTFQDIALAGEVIGVVYIGVELSELRERTWRYAAIVGVLLAGCSLVALGLAARLQRIISQPIEDLARTVATVAAGKDYAVRASKQGEDELGHLIDGFNEMLAQIQARDTALQNARNDLEGRVEERTSELRQENTERRNVETALRESQTLYLTLVEQLPAGIFRKDREGRFTFANAWFCDLLGVTADQLLHKTARDYSAAMAGRRDIDPARIQQTAAGSDHHGQIMQNGRRIEVEECYREPDGTTKYLHVVKSAIKDADGRIIGSQGMLFDITERKQTEAKLAEIHQELLNTSRQAGMAEVATGVLHNVGNVLNSVNVSATLVADQLRHSQVANIAKLAALLAGHKSDLASFFTGDARGQMIPGYLGTLADSLAAEQATMLAELAHLRENIDHIKTIVAMQQSHANNSGFIETATVADLVEDALRLSATSLARHDVKLVREFQHQPTVSTDKHKVVQILINLVRNAQLACDESGRTDKQITVRTTSGAHCAKIAIVDNGVGIPAENLTRIFNHGFTTRKTGHGFGLHSGALAAKELGGTLHVHSDGPGKGAVFTLEIPLATPQPAARNAPP